jgi:hypothetical protein
MKNGNLRIGVTVKDDIVMIDDLGFGGGLPITMVDGLINSLTEQGA